MKQNLLAGERYGLFRPNIVYILVLVVFVLFVYSKAVIAQADGKMMSKNAIIPISAQQRVPAEIWTRDFMLYTHPGVESVSLDKYKDRPLILAFWSSTCGVCFHRLPFLKQMQAMYEENLNILLVNSIVRDSIPVVHQRFSRLDSTLHFPSIVLDDYLCHLFPHGPIPFYVWISPGGRVDAITSQSYLTEDNISRFISGYEKH